MRLKYLCSFSLNADRAAAENSVMLRKYVMGRKAIKGVLHNFTETYTSRYSDYGGYWLFGVLLSEVDRLNINLLDTGYDASEKTPASAAVLLAAAEFKDQIEKARVSLSWIRVGRV